jgi:hypothetical protein
VAGVDVSRWNLGLPLALLGGCTRIDYVAAEDGGTHGDSSGSSTAVSVSITVADATTQPQPTSAPTSMEGSEDVDPSVGECDACQPGECCVMNECVPYYCPPKCPIELCCAQACPLPEDCEYDEHCGPGYACNSGICQLVEYELYCELQPYFEQQLPIFDAPGIRALAFVDADGDLLRDLVIGSSGGVQILRSADGTPFDIASGIDAASLAVGDLDGDGDEDIVVGDRSPESGVVVLLHEDGESFVQLPASSLPGVEQVVLADIERPGAPDVFALDDGEAASWLRNTGAGELEPAEMFADSATSLAIGMIDADASTDLVLHQGTHELAYTGGPSSDFEVLAELGGNSVSPRLLTIGNYDGVGPDDVVALQSNEGTTIAVQWSGPALIGFPPFRSRWLGEMLTAVRADLDGDGFDDIVMTTTSRFELRIAKGGPDDGTGVIACTAIISPMWLPAALVAVGDLTGDGLPDLAISDGALVALLTQIQ